MDDKGKIVGERIAVIENKIDNLSDKIQCNINSQREIDRRQDKQLENLDDTKADKSDIKDIRKILYWSIATSITTLLTVLTSLILYLLLN